MISDDYEKEEINFTDRIVAFLFKSLPPKGRAEMRHTLIAPP